MGEIYYKAKDLFERELDKMVSKGDVSKDNLELFYKVVDIIKDLDEICEKEEEMGYENEYSGRRGYSRRMSRWSPNMMGGYSNAGGYSNNGGEYSREGSYANGSSTTSSTKNMLYQLMHEAPNDRERTMIQRWIDELG